MGDYQCDYQTTSLYNIIFCKFVEFPLRKQTNKILNPLQCEIFVECSFSFKYFDSLPTH